MYQNLITINLRDLKNNFKKELAKVEQEEIAEAFQSELQAQRELQNDFQAKAKNKAQITQNESLFSQEELKPSFKPKKSFDEIMNQRLKNQK